MNSLYPLTALSSKRYWKPPKRYWKPPRLMMSQRRPWARTAMTTFLGLLDRAAAARKIGREARGHLRGARGLLLARDYTARLMQHVHDVAQCSLYMHTG